MKLDSKYLASLISEVLNEDTACDSEIVIEDEYTPEVVIQNFLNYITMAKCDQRGRKNSFDFKEFYKYVTEFKDFDYYLKPVQFIGYRDAGGDDDIPLDLEKQMTPKYKALYSAKAGPGRLDGTWDESGSIARKIKHKQYEWVLNKDVSYYLKMADRIMFDISPKYSTKKESLKKFQNPLKESDDEEFAKLLDLAKQGDGNEMQAWEMHEYFDLTSEQIEQLRNIVAKEIIYNAEEPGKNLIELGYDFHKDFTEVYGVTPPRDQDFVFNNGDTRLAVDLPGKRKLIFTFWFGADNTDYPSDPWIFMLNEEGEYVTIQTPQAGEIEMSIATDGAYAGETSGQISKEDVPIQIKKHTGWTESDLVKEKLDRKYLYRMINEVLSEEDDDSDDDFLEKLFSIVSSGEVEQAFDLADSLGMEKELLQRIVNDEGNDVVNHGITWAISDRGTVAIVDYALTRPELGDKTRQWLGDETIGVPFTKVGKWDSIKGRYSSTINYEMYRTVALLVFQDILKNYDQFNELNEENFGAKSRSEEVLEEGWEDQWPNELKGILLAIQSNVSEPFQESVAKIFLRTANIKEIAPVRLVRAMSNKVHSNAQSGMKLHVNKIKYYQEYIVKTKEAPTIDFPQEEKDEQIAEFEEKIKKEKEFLDLYKAFSALADEPFYFGRDRRKEVLQQFRAISGVNPNTNMPSMRYINKTIKSIRKQLSKWRENNTDGFGRINVSVSDAINHLDYMIKELTTRVFTKFEDDMKWLFRFLKSIRGSGEDTAKKLASILKKNKDLPMDEYIEEIKKFSLQNNRDYFRDCDDVPDGDPCVFLKLDNGMFWHSTATDYCEITQVEMNNCGSASESGSILYNLMSTSEGGTQRFHVTLEYNEDKNQIVQVLGQANTLPKEKYWSSIAEFFSAMGDPELNKDAFQHLYGGPDDNETLDQEIQAFIQGIGARTRPRAAFRTWEAMKEQIRDGYYSEKIETLAPINNQTNVFRVSLSYSGMTGPADQPGSEAMITLNLQVILQTKEEDKAEEWRKANPDIFRKAREFGESQEFKQLLYNALPERMTRANRLDIKYSKISNPRLRLGGMGNYKMRMRVSFKIGVRSWNESKGELLVARFQDLLSDTLRDLPAQAMLVFLAVEGMGKTNEGKIKLDRDYLNSLITEVLQEDNGLEDMMRQFDNPDTIKQGIELFATSQGISINDMWHNKLESEPIKDFNWRELMFKLQDEYVFIMDSRKDAEMLAKMLKDFYADQKREIYVTADSHNYGDHRVMLDIEK